MENHLVYYGNETLKSVAEEFRNIDENTIRLIESMYNIMYRERGIGLAAPQINISKRLITIDIEEEEGRSLTLINPVIKEVSQRTNPYEEGCLSLPGIQKEIIRPSELLVTGITPDEKEVEFEADGLLARVIQHEVDHLNGIVFVDHLEDFERKELRPQLKKIKKMNKE